MGDLKPLRAVVSTIEGPIFAVLDGAQFEHLPKALYRAGLQARCLYLDRGDNHPDRLVTAPHLVGPLDEAARERVFRLLEEANPSAGVFWECEASPSQLYLHLRRINRIVVPELSADQVRALLPVRGAEDAPPSLLADLATSFPLFRHSDANVLAQMKLGLEDDAVARLLGPARRIACQASAEWGGLQLFDHPRPGQATPGGPLRLSPHETLALREARLLRFDIRLKEALDHERPELGSAAPGEFPARLRAARRRAVYVHGAANERHILDLVELELVRGEAVVDDRDFRRIMDRRGWPMERRCRALRRRFLDRGDAAAL